MKTALNAGPLPALLAALAIAYAPLANAADWVRVGAPAGKAAQTAPSKFFVDKSSMTKTGALIKVWSLTSYTKEQSLDDDTKYLSMKTQHLYSCADRTTTLQMQLYYADNMGKTAPVRNFKYEKFNPEEIVPDSLSDLALKIVCAKSATPPAASAPAAPGVAAPAAKP